MSSDDGDSSDANPQTDNLISFNHLIRHNRPRWRLCLFAFKKFFMEVYKNYTNGRPQTALALYVL